MSAVSTNSSTGNAGFSASTPGGSPVQTCPTALHAAFPGILTAQAAARAAAKAATLSPADAATYSKALGAAGSDQERAYITKAFAACHTPSECAKFGDDIRGKSPTWMQDNLSLTGSSTGTGVQQQWSHSCNATTAQALRGQMDPMYALQVHEDNPNWGKLDGDDAMKENPLLASEQRDMLTSTYRGTFTTPHAGVAVPVNDPLGIGGRGRFADDLFNDLKSTTGVEYKTVLQPANPAALIDAGLATGAPVPLIIGGRPGDTAHYVLATGSSGSPPIYSIHDPADGVTVLRSQADVVAGRLDIAGYSQVTAVESPSLLPPAAAGKSAC